MRSCIHAFSLCVHVLTYSGKLQLNLPPTWTSSQKVPNISKNDSAIDWRWWWRCCDSRCHRLGETEDEWEQYAEEQMATNTSRPEGEVIAHNGWIVHVGLFFFIFFLEGNWGGGVFKCTDFRLTSIDNLLMFFFYLVFYLMFHFWKKKNNEFSWQIQESFC